MSKSKKSSGKSSEVLQELVPITGFAEVNGTSIYYEMLGEGHPLVLIHGRLLDKRMWDDQFTAFATRYQVIRYDVRGFGFSPLPARLYSDAQDLYTLLQFLNVEKAYLVGLSLGGLIAIDFTLQHPEMVQALVAAAPGLSGYTPPDDEITEQTRQNRDKIVAAIKAEDALRAIELWLADPVFTPALENAAVRERLEELLSEYSFSHYFHPEFLLPLEPPAIKRLGEIQTPTLVVVGERDVRDCHAIANILVSGIAGARKVVAPAVGHISPMEKPTEFNEIVLDFLSKLSTNRE